MVILFYLAPGPRKIENFDFISFSLEVTRQYTSNEPSTTICRSFQGKICPKTCFGPKMPKYGYSAPVPQKWKFLIFIIFTRRDSLIPFQRALNHFLQITLSQDMNLFSYLSKMGQNMEKIRENGVKF